MATKEETIKKTIKDPILDPVLELGLWFWVLDLTKGVAEK